MATAESFDRPFRVERQVYGYSVVVRVAGEVDAMTARELRSEVTFAFALATRAAPVVIDLSEVVFFAAAGVNELQRGLQEAKAAGVRLRVVAPDRCVLRPLEITGLAGELDTFTTLSEALSVRTPERVRTFALPGTAR